MASWNKKRGKQVVVFIYDKGKKKQLPRKLTEHLDNEPDHNIDFWVKDYAEKHGLGRQITHHFDTDKRIEDFIKFLTSRKKAYNTIKEYERLLNQHVKPYFLGNDPPLIDLNEWPKISIRMEDHLTAKGLTPSLISRCNTSLRRFFKWLAEERYVLSSEIPLRAPYQEARKETPLERVLTPSEIIELAAKEIDTDRKLILLLGYFCSLRPQEVFGLKRSDFSGGKSVAELECSKSMLELGLYSKLAVKLTRQKNKRGETVTPKNGSQGWVSCFHEVAARMVVDMLKTIDRDYIIEATANKIYHTWQYNFGIKDLRRSSLYWLGHNTKVSQNQLMKHARHSSYETTLLYLRRPDEEVNFNLNLED